MILKRNNLQILNQSFKNNSLHYYSHSIPTHTHSIQQSAIVWIESKISGFLQKTVTIRIGGVGMKLEVELN